METEFGKNSEESAVYGGVDGEASLVPTPLIVYMQSNGCHILLKDETKQIGGSFKTRGATNFVRKNSQSCDRFVAASTGNHAIGLAWACRKIGIKCIIFVPENCPKTKQEKIAAASADLRLTGSSFEDCERAALQFCDASGRCCYAPSFDHIDIIEGHRSLFREIDLQFAGRIDRVYVPVGGGGLFAAAAHHYRDQPTETVGVEFKDYRRIDDLLAGRTPEFVSRKQTYPPSLEGILVSSIGAVPLSILAHAVSISSRQVSLVDLQNARRRFEGQTGIRVELAAVAGLVAAERDTVGSTVTRLCVLTGGNCD